MTKQGKMKHCCTCIDTPVISLTMSVIRERLRREILATKTSIKDNREDGTSSSECSSHGGDLDAELADLQDMLPQQFEITGLELLHNNSDDTDSQCYEEEYSYDSSLVNSFILAQVRIENKHLDCNNNNKKVSDGSSCANNSSMETSLSSNIDNNYPTDMLKRCRTVERSPSVGSYAANSIDGVVRNKSMKKSTVYGQRRLSVFSDHTNETDGDEPNDSYEGKYMYGFVHTFEAPLQPLSGHDTTNTVSDRRMQFRKMSSTTDSIGSNTISTYANDSFTFRKRQNSVAVSTKSSLGSKSFDDMRSMNSISVEMFESDRMNTGNRAA
jgi:hypothetical protein